MLHKAGLAALISLFALVGAILIAALAFTLAGGKWFIIETPSMGQAAPVGTLVLTTPVRVADLQKGDIISFHPPTEPKATYTHRVYSITNGVVLTKGDNNGRYDPWTLTQKDLIGTSISVLPVIGWIVRSVPYLLAGFAILFVLTRFLKRRWRASIWLTGTSLILTVTVLILKPFTNLILLTTSTGSAHPTATVVSTGILPIKVTAEHGNTVHLVAGQLGQMDVSAILKAEHFYRITSSLDLPIWGWIIFWAFCLTPMLYVFLVGLPPVQEAELIESESENLEVLS